MSHEIANGYSTRPGVRPGIVFNDAPWPHFCLDCKAEHINNSRTWKRCKACYAKRQQQAKAQHAARKKAVGR